MAYDENLVQRVTDFLIGQPGLKVKKMFGGVGYLVNGHMACGVLQDHLIVRVGADRYQEALARPHTRLFDTTGRPMTGWVMVEPAGYQADADLQGWVQQGLDFVAGLPPK